MRCNVVGCAVAVVAWDSFYNSLLAQLSTQVLVRATTFSMMYHTAHTLWAGRNRAASGAE